MYELERSLKTIAKINGKTLDFQQERFKRDQEAQSSTKSEHGSTRYYFGKRSIRINLVIMTYVWLATSFNYYLI